MAPGVSNCYLIKGEHNILVDTGPPKKVKKILKKLADLSVVAQDISLIVLTHGHWDHVGSLFDLKETASCKVAVHQREKKWVEQSLTPLPPSLNRWGKMLMKMSLLFQDSINFPGTSVDLVLEDSGLSLEPYGIDGEILYTPGHTSGSMSLLLSSGDALVGDLAVNGLPLRIGPGMSPFVEDADELRKSWKLLLDKGAERIFPGHGAPFEAGRLKA